MKISVLTSSVPQRAEMLAEAVASVTAQTHEDHEHLIAVDHERRGGGAVLNDLLRHAEGEFITVLDDDDLLGCDHLTVLSSLAPTADVIYSEPIVVGGTHRSYESAYDPDLLDTVSIVSHTALIRRSVLDHVGGWSAVKDFDWDLFKRLRDAGARFHKVEGVTTWTYRLHGDNWSRGGLGALG